MQELKNEMLQGSDLLKTLKTICGDLFKIAVKHFINDYQSLDIEYICDADDEHSEGMLHCMHYSLFFFTFDIS